MSDILHERCPLISVSDKSDHLTLILPVGTANIFQPGEVIFFTSLPVFKVKAGLSQEVNIGLTFANEIKGSVVGRHFRWLLQIPFLTFCERLALKTLIFMRFSQESQVTFSSEPGL